VNLSQAVFRAATTTAVVVVAAVSAVCAAPEVLAANTIHIAVIGDSYTAGSGEGGTGARSWPELAWKLLSKRGLDVDAELAQVRGHRVGTPRGVVGDVAAGQAGGSREGDGLCRMRHRLRADVHDAVDHATPHRSGVVRGLPHG